MRQAEQPDVIGVDASPRRAWPTLPLLAGVAGLIVGLGVGAVTADQFPSRDVRAEEARVPERAPLKQADAGLVYVCDGHARAFLFAQGLPPERAEVKLPLRGDSVLLPILIKGAEVLTGTPEGHQYFVPEDGYLMVVQQLGVPDSETVSALVGEQQFTLAVRQCDGGAEAAVASPAASEQPSAPSGGEFKAACNRAIGALDAISAETIGSRPPLRSEASAVVSEAGRALSDAHSLVEPALDGIAFTVRTAIRSARAALGDISNGDVDPFPLSTLAEARVELQEKCG